ncbi:ATP-binding cassette domain-containing protein [Xanthobacter sp. V4C-4]|uniref:ATP-binding cassette domain-containing protein n=1 Tax=Xanthobacter cornucopiae TaxID=3119924 RepID=UPI0037280B27
MPMLKALWHALPRRRQALARPAEGPREDGAGAEVSSVVALRREGRDHLRGEGAIELRGVRKALGRRPKETQVLTGVDAIFPRGRTIGVLGAAGAGKSTLVHLLTGNTRPDQGQVVHGMRVSWPMSARDIFRKEMTIRGNVRLLSALYGAWAPEMIDAVKEIGKIRGQDLDTPINKLAPDFMIRASTSLCYALDFDCYVADDNLCGGSKTFREYIKALYQERQKTHSLIIVTKNAGAIRDLCDDLYILEDGIIKTYENRLDAYRIFKGAALNRQLDPKGEEGDDEL